MGVESFRLVADKWLCACIFVGVLSSFGMGVIFPLFTIVIGNFANIFAEYQYGTLSKNEYDSRVDYQTWSFLVLTAVSFTCSTVDYLVWQSVGELVRNRFSNLTLSCILRKEQKWIESSGKTVQEMHTSYLTDASEIKSVFCSQIPTILKSISTFVCGCGVAFSRSAVLSLVILSTVPIVSVMFAIIQRFSVKKQEESYKVSVSAFGAAQQVFHNIRLVHASNAEQQEQVNFSKRVKLAESLLTRNQYLQSISQSLGILLLYCMFALGFYVGAILVSQSKLSPGGVISVFLPCFYGSQSLQTGFKVLDGLSKSLDNVHFSLSLLLIPPEPSSTVQAASIESISLSNVSFSYPSRPEKAALKGVSVTFRQGQITALVGASGSGKSTIAQLVANLYKPQSGTCSWHGVNESEWYRDYLSYVEQEPKLYDMTVRENVALGLPSFVDELVRTNTSLNSFEHKISSQLNERIVAACQMAGVHHDIELLPGGYSCKVGEQGHLLSGGQKQRVSIARALLKSPRVLVLDEATSAIEHTAEAALSEAVAQGRESRVTIIIAHRLGALKHADVVHVMEAGEIVESGTLEELSNRTGSNSAFYALHRAEIAQSEANKSLNEPFGKDSSPSTPQSPSLSFDGSSGSLFGQFRDFSVPSYSVARFSAMLEKRFSLATNDRVTCLGVGQVNAEEELDDLYSEVWYDGNSIDSADLETRVKGLQRHHMIQIVYDLIANESERKWLVLVGLAAGFGSTFGMPVYSVILSKILFAYTLQTSTAIVNETLLYVFYLVLLAEALATMLFTQTLALYVSSGDLLHRVRSSLFKYIVCGQPIAYFDSKLNSSANLTYQLAYNTTQVYGLLTGVVANVVSICFTALLGVIFALSYGWKLSLVGLACFPVWAVAAKLQGYLSLKSERHAKALRVQAYALSTDATGNFTTTKHLGLETAFCSSVRYHFYTSLRYSVRNSALIAPLNGLSTSMLYLMEAAVFRFGAYLIGRQEYDLQTMMTVWVILIITADAVIRSSASMAQTSSVLVASEHLLQLLALKKDQHPAYAKYDTRDRVSEDGETQLTHIVSQRYSPLPEIFPGFVGLDHTSCIEFKNVCFAYPERPEAVILKNFCLDIPQFRMTAIMGASGSGKSTLAALILNFYQPNSGSVVFLGVPLNAWRVQELRNKIGLVQQEPVLFDTTIAGNIAYGQDNSNFSKGDIIRAAKEAQIHDFIVSLPQKYNTRILGASSLKLSGGQKQRIAIARALIRRPAVLILDEATSSLDSVTESDILDTLERLDYPCTKIVIAHRKSCLIRADLIVSMSRGQVVSIASPKDTFGTLTRR